MSLYCDFALRSVHVISTYRPTSFTARPINLQCLVGFYDYGTWFAQ